MDRSAPPRISSGGDMASIRSLSLVRFTAFLAIACGMLAGCGPPEPPDLEAFARATSPSGRQQAVAYTLSGGGAAGWMLYRIAIGEPARDQSRLGADDIAQLRHAHGLAIAWADDSTLLIRYPESAALDTVVSEARGVRVQTEVGGDATESGQ